MSDEKIEQLLRDICLNNPELHTVVQSIRALIYSLIPHASERVMYGGLIFADATPFCGVFVYTRHISLEFSRGCDLQDPHQVLEGKGKVRRHIKIQEATDIEAKYLSTYLLEAHQNSLK
ncbi:DUF1801 domain-containing protein [Iodobacter arcticus]|uniref:DUF1801 domain-containing protein n=1 Tax=Iodobacter arcticus TaxID=590593 RepID=A0ABW2R1H3_9NEIS